MDNINILDYLINPVFIPSLLIGYLVMERLNKNNKGYIVPGVFLVGIVCLLPKFLKASDCVKGVCQMNNRAMVLLVDLVILSIIFIIMNIINYNVKTIEKNELEDTLLKRQKEFIKNPQSISSKIVDYKEENSNKTKP